MSLNVTLTTELQKLAPSSVIELFEVDATSLGGDLMRFHAGTNELTQNIIWQGHEYVRYPIQASGFEFTGQGQFPRPKLTVSNAFSAITTILLAYNDLIGVKVTRKRTLVKFLDPINFGSGTNPSADATAEFQEDVYYIDRKASEDRDQVTFELASSCDLIGIQLPRRQIIQNVCTWKYRGPECGFTGPPVFDENDNLLSEASTPEATALISAYNAHTAAVNLLAAKEIALSAAAQNKAVSCAPVPVQSLYDPAPATFTGVIERLLVNSFTAYLNNVVVPLGSIYAVGSDIYPYNTNVNAYDEFNPYLRVHNLLVYNLNPPFCASATMAYNNALADRDAAKAALIAAQTLLDAKAAALPSNDPLNRIDRCGKRLASCKIRFGNDSELPFGSFPSVGLIK
jgi:lambda family phage minor tail protein L